MRPLALRHKNLRPCLYRTPNFTLVFLVYNFACYTRINTVSLTLWEPAYDIFVLWFRPKNSSFRLPYQHPSSSADCARELLNGSNGKRIGQSFRLHSKKIVGWGCGFFVSDVIKWSSFGVILAHVAGPKAQPLDQIISLKFLLETRLKSESFEPLINFLAFLVQKLWSKINNLMN